MLGLDFRSTSVRRTERYVTTRSERPEGAFFTPRALSSRSIAAMIKLIEGFVVGGLSRHEGIGDGLEKRGLVRHVGGDAVCRSLGETSRPGTAHT